MNVLENPAWINAVASALIGILTIIFVRGRGSGDKEDEKPSLHQDIVRPETASEIKSAAALEAIAKSADMLERHVAILIDRGRGRGRDSDRRDYSSD